MSRTTSSNYSSPSFPIANADTDPFDANDIQQLAAAVNGHDHTTGKGVVISSGGGGGTASLLLNYTASTDIASGASVTADTWTNLGPSHSIAVGSSGSRLVTISAGGAVNMRFSSNSQQGAFGSRLQIDGTTNVIIGGTGDTWVWDQVTGPKFGGSPFIGVRTYTVQLSAGSHTIQVQVYARGFAATMYCRASSFPTTEGLFVQAVQLP